MRAMILRPMALCAAVVALGLGGGLAGIASAGEMRHGAMPHGTAAMHHSPLEMGDLPAPPMVRLTVHKDPKAGWNLQVQVENFRFAPEHASTPHVPGEGHAHLFIDGKKITRLYGEWYHIPMLRPGTHKITVTLNANSHEDLMVKGKVVSDTQEIRVPAK
jgi:hypothetical protein